MSMQYVDFSVLDLSATVTAQESCSVEKKNTKQSLGDLGKATLWTRTASRGSEQRHPKR